MVWGGGKAKSWCMLRGKKGLGTWQQACPSYSQRPHEVLYTCQLASTQSLSVPERESVMLGCDDVRV